MTDLLKGVAFVDAFGAEVSLSKVTSNDLIAVSEQFAVCSSWVGVGGGGWGVGCGVWGVCVMMWFCV